jgi:hypothetical protein
LGKCHAPVLIKARKGAYTFVAFVAVNTLSKFMHRKEVHYLRENRSALIQSDAPFTKGECSVKGVQPVFPNFKSVTDISTIIAIIFS